MSTASAAVGEQIPAAHVMLAVAAFEIVTFASDGDVAAQNATETRYGRIEDRMARALITRVVS